MTEATRTFTLKHTSDREYTDKDLAYWIITAFEGGIDYWCDRVEPVERDDAGKWQPVTGDRYKHFQDHDTELGFTCPPYANPLFWENGKRGYRLYDPYEQRWCDHVLTMSSMQKALQYQPPKRRGIGISPNWYRKVVDRLLSEDYDAGDADTVVQVAVFGEVVYG